MIFRCFNQCRVLQELRNITPNTTSYLISCLVIVTALYGCGSQPTSTSNASVAPETISSSSLDFLELASRSSGAEAEQYRLLALKQSILINDYQLARELGQQINQNLLSDSEINSMQLSLIPLTGAGDETHATLALLEALVPSLADVPEWNYYMGNAQQALDNNATATEYYYSCSTHTPGQIDYRSNCTESLWALLLDSDKNASKTFEQVDQDYNAWSELASLIQNNRGSIENQTKSLEQWFAANVDHPARINPPKQILDLIQLELTSPRSIALILPLSGRLQSAGEAVLDGFLSAAYLTAAQGYMAPQIEIFDSGALPIELIAEIISADIFDIAVGPLDTENVEGFASAVSTELPALYLNRVSSSEFRPRTQVGFSLAVESEARQAAQTAILDGHKSALVLIEDTSIGERAAGTFAEEWVKEDRQIYDLVRLSDATTLTERLERSFHVDQSESRKSQLQTLLGKRLEFTPRRRQDIDTIFLASSSVLARQITPTLAFLFAQDIPVLATSRVFDENSGSEDNRDLAFVNFLAPPWLAEAGQPLEQSASARSVELQKLEAMGVDAFYISRRFRQFEDPKFRYQGKTGSIFVGQDGNLTRTMEWVRIDGERLVSTDP